MKENLAWESLKPNKLVEVWLHHKRYDDKPEKIYILDAYTISPDVGERNNHMGRRFFGVLIRNYGMRYSTILNNSYEIIAHEGALAQSRPGTYEEIFQIIEAKVQLLVKKKCKKGYKDVSHDVSFHIPALHKNREGLISSSITDSCLTSDIAQQNFKNRDVGKFINIL